MLDRNRGGAYLAVLIVGAGMFGVFLFLTYYMQLSLHYSPVVSGVAFLPMIAMVVVSANLSNVVLLPRTRPQAAGHRRHAAGRGQPGVADQDRRCTRATHRRCSGR